MRRAFSLAELLVVTGIVIALVGILRPVFLSAKSAAGRTVCQSNLRQMYLALALYREGEAGIDAPAPTWRMGLPPFFAPIYLEKVIGKSAASASNLRCSSPFGYPTGKAPAAYITMWPLTQPVTGIDQSKIDALQAEWIASVQHMSSATMIFVDPNHQHTLPVSYLAEQRAMGMTLGGGLRMRSSRGLCLDQKFWY
jgi:type II secretory pathway pseudopilin PulG